MAETNCCWSDPSWTSTPVEVHRSPCQPNAKMSSCRLTCSYEWSFFWQRKRFETVTQVLKLAELLANFNLKNSVDKICQIHGFCRVRTMWCKIVPVILWRISTAEMAGIYATPQPDARPCQPVCRCLRLLLSSETSVCKMPPRTPSWSASPPATTPSGLPSPAPCSEVRLQAPRQGSSCAINWCH